MEVPCIQRPIQPFQAIPSLTIEVCSVTPRTYLLMHFSIAHHIPVMIARAVHDLTPTGRSQPPISATADLYRRFGVAGILFGVPLAALITALFTRWVFRVMLFRDALLGIVLLQLLLSSFLQELWGTLLGSSFDWLYAIPKHLIFIYLLVAAVRIGTGAYARRGLLAYANGS